MKKFFVTTACLLMMFSTTGVTFAGTPITNEMGEKYFANCVTGAQKEGTMTPDTQNRYCACTALNMQKSMTQEDLKDLSSQGAPARAALNKVLVSVNGPCMQYPVHDMLNKKCMADVKNTSICSCLSTRMGNYMKDISARMMPKLLAENPNIYDLMGPIMESQEFVQTERNIALSCATNPNSK